MNELCQGCGERFDYRNYYLIPYLDHVCLHKNGTVQTFSKRINIMICPDCMCSTNFLFGKPSV
jgi:NMD protein affecting ribosome stability and mRNA decay